LVVAGGGWAPEMLSLVVVVETWHLVVVMVIGMMIRMKSWFLGLILDPGRTQGYV